MENQSRYKTKLPINRKESYYTGTVFPMLVAENRFAALRDLLKDRVPLLEGGWQEEWDLQFFTEYSFKESFVSGGPNHVFRPEHGGESKDTPDIVLYIYPVGSQGGHQEGALIAIEAKMFTQPSLADLWEQLKGQEKILREVAEKLGGVSLHHLVLAPEESVKKYRAESDQALEEALDVCGWLTWERVHKCWKSHVSGAGESPTGLFADALCFALDNFSDLVSKSAPGGANRDAKLTGREVVEKFRDSKEPFPYEVMGRGGGFNGALLKGDLDSPDAWRDQVYEVALDQEPPNHNWFRIKWFVDELERRGHISLDGSG